MDFNSTLTKILMNEMPAPVHVDPNKINRTPKTGTKYSSAQIIKNFSEYFQVIGKGSSRIAFIADIDFSLFKSDDLKTMGVSKSSKGSKQMVFKVALNPKGLLQNKNELDVWNDVKGTSLARFLLPIVDHAGNPKYNNDIQYTVNNDVKDSNTTPFWIQMPLVKIVKRKEFNSLFRETFGEVDYEELALYNIYSKDKRILRLAKERIEELKELEEISKTQLKNLTDLMKLCDTYKLGIGDLHRVVNWGINEKNEPVILDYGFDANTIKYYWGKEKGSLKASITNDGEVKIQF